MAFPEVADENPQPSRIVKTRGFFRPFMLLPEGLPAGELRPRAELLFDAQKLIVLSDAVGAAGRSSLDLTGACGHYQVGDERVFGLARPVRNDGRVTRIRGHRDRRQ